jgi:excisionase family DNA binding protein
MSDSNAKVMSTREAADALGISDRRVRIMCEQGQLRCTMVGDRWAVYADSVEQEKAIRLKHGKYHRRRTP